jgi:Zn-dependent protease
MLNGWAFAAIFVALLFAHEMGHVWAARRIGLPVSAPMFIPFLGALITMKRNPRSVAHEAYMAAGGPLLGTLGCMVAFTIAWATQSAFLFHMAAIGFFLNLFNLVPVSPLDGGRIIASVSPWLWLVGALVMIPLLIWMNAWIFLLILAFMVWPQMRRLFQGRDQEWKVYHTCTGRQRLYASGTWMALVVLLGGLLAISSVGAGSPGNPLLGAGLLLGWPFSAIVGAICFFTWPLEERAFARS